MKSSPALLVAGVFALLVGSLYYFFQNEPAQLVDVSDITEVNNPVNATSTSNEPPAGLSNANTNVSNDESKSTGDILDRPDTNPNFKTFRDRVTEVQARRNGQSVNAAELWNAAQQPAAWKPLDNVPESLHLSEDEKHDGRKFIEFSPLKLESLVTGDTLEIDMGEAGKSFNAVIEGVRSEDDGRNVTWTGNSLDENFPGRLTITKGDTLIVGGISTPDGLYEIQVHDNKGWIVSNATLFRKGTDQHITVPDELLKNPPQDVVLLPLDPTE